MVRVRVRVRVSVRGRVGIRVRVRANLVGQQAADDARGAVARPALPRPLRLQARRVVGAARDGLALLVRLGRRR